MPKGIRIQKVSNIIYNNKEESKIQKTNVVHNTPMLEELFTKLNRLPNVKIDIANPNENKKPEDIDTIIANLNKCGLTIQKSYDKINGHKKTKPVIHSKKSDLKPTNERELIPCNIIEALEYLNEDLSESEYEIETLEEHDSDVEFIESTKVKKRRKNCNESEFIKIRSTSFMCILCLSKFSTLKLLTEHMNSPEPCSNPIIPCSVCKKEFPSKSRLTAHMEMHKEKPKYFCDKCGKSFKNPHKLAIHLEFMHTEYFDAIADNFQCKLCEHETLSRELILQHVNTNHLHISTFLCHICGKSFMNEVRLKVHIMTHRETKSFLCQICSKAFKTPHSLQAHIRTHSQEKRFICDECGKAFKKGCTLRDHKKTHSSEFSFNCFICDKHFVSKPALNVHLKNHL